MTHRDPALLDDFFLRSLHAPDASLVSHGSAARDAARDAGLPDIHVSQVIAKHLHLLARASGATRVLEVGTLAGFSTIWLAAAVPETGLVTTLELDQKHADVARANLERAGLLERTDIRVGAAADTLAQLVRERESGDCPLYDLAFIDADKENIPTYVERALELLRPGGLLLVDNVLRRGRVIDEDNRDEDVLAMRALIEGLATDARLSANVVQIVGTKGHDAVLMAVVN